MIRSGETCIEIRNATLQRVNVHVVHFPLARKLENLVLEFFVREIKQVLFNVRDVCLFRQVKVEFENPFPGVTVVFDNR